MSKDRDVGFDEPCMAAYDRIQMLCTHSKNVFERLKYSGNYTSAPTFEETIEWLKKHHNIHIHPNFYENSFSKEMQYEYQLHWKFADEWRVSKISFQENSKLKAIEDAIYLIEQKK